MPPVHRAYTRVEGAQGFCRPLGDGYSCEPILHPVQRLGKVVVTVSAGEAAVSCFKQWVLFNTPWQKCLVILRLSWWYTHKQYLHMTRLATIG